MTKCAQLGLGRSCLTQTSMRNMEFRNKTILHPMHVAPCSDPPVDPHNFLTGTFVFIVIQHSTRATRISQRRSAVRSKWCL